LSGVIPGRRRFHPYKNNSLDRQKQDQKYPQVRRRGKNNKGYNEDAGKKVNEKFFLCPKARAADPFYPVAEKAAAHDPPVKPGGAFHKTKRRGQQKRRRGQYRKDNAGYAQGEKNKAPDYK
jgi:hypothetical protein